MNSPEPGNLSLQSDGLGAPGQQAQQYYYKQNNYKSIANQDIVHQKLRQDKSPPMNRPNFDSHLSFNASSYTGANTHAPREIMKDRSNSRDQYESNASSMIPNVHFK